MPFIGIANKPFSEGDWIPRDGKWLANGLFHLLINGIYWGYNPLILTFDPNFLGHPSWNPPPKKSNTEDRSVLPAISGGVLASLPGQAQARLFVIFTQQKHVGKNNILEDH